MMGMYRRSTIVFGGVSIALGIAIMVRTPSFVGVLIGLLFVAVGVGRVYLLYRR
jgi:dipeptide/tripeptide permease